MTRLFFHHLCLGNIITGEEIRGAEVKRKTPIAQRKEQEPWNRNGGTVPLPCRLESSNRYANGSDQNVGNVLTDRRTIRVNAPPGGHCSFSISSMFS